MKRSNESLMSQHESPTHLGLTGPCLQHCNAGWSMADICASAAALSGSLVIQPRRLVRALPGVATPAGFSGHSHIM